MCVAERGIAWTYVTILHELNMKKRERRKEGWRERRGRRREVGGRVQIHYDYSPWWQIGQILVLHELNIEKRGKERRTERKEEEKRGGWERRREVGGRVRIDSYLWDVHVHCGWRDCFDWRYDTPWIKY
jgi:hypothetical protein